MAQRQLPWDARWSYCGVGDSGPSLQAIVHETTVRVGTVAIRCSEARRMTFLALDGMDEVCLLHLSRNQAECSGLLSQFWHLHVVFFLLGLLILQRVN